MTTDPVRAGKRGKWVYRPVREVERSTHYVDPITADRMQVTEYVCGCVRDIDLDAGLTVWWYCRGGKLCVRKSRAEEVAAFLGYGYSPRSEGFVW